MAHAIWNGTINFGLVTIPVRLFTAVRESEGLRFNFLHDKDHGRINNKRVCSECGKAIEWEHVARGYEYEKGKYIVIDDEELKRLTPEATQSVDIVEFVDLAEINPMFYDKPYYLEPEKKGRHAYALLREALLEADKVGIARVVIRTREHLAAVKPNGNALILEIMHFADEIVDPDEFEFPARDQAATGEMKAAQILIDTMAAKFEPASFKYKYRDQVRAMIEARARGKKIKVKKPAARPRADVVNLMEILQQSLKETKKQRAPAARASRRPRARVAA